MNKGIIHCFGEEEKRYDNVIKLESNRLEDYFNCWTINEWIVVRINESNNRPSLSHMN